MRFGRQCASKKAKKQDLRGKNRLRCNEHHLTCRNMNFKSLFSAKLDCLVDYIAIGISLRSGTSSGVTCNVINYASLGTLLGVFRQTMSPLHFAGERDSGMLLPNHFIFSGSDYES